jgi:hypothetical protein
MFLENAWPSLVSSSSICWSLLGELLAELGQLLVDLLEPRANLGRLVDAGTPGVAQRVGDEPPGLGVGAGDVDRGERVVHLPIEREVGVEPGDLLLARARGIADRLVGMNLRHQASHRVARARRGQQVVVAHQGLVDRPRCAGDDLRAQRLGAPQTEETLRSETLELLHDGDRL